jgi:hypothetical protein
MTLVRFAIMIGIVLLAIGGIAFFLPGEFLYSGVIVSSVQTYGAFILPSLKTNPSLMFFVQKSPAFLFIIMGLVLILVGIVKSIK